MVARLTRDHKSGIPGKGRESPPLFTRYTGYTALKRLPTDPCACAEPSKSIQVAGLQAGKIFP